jgi:anti-anti-sigma factor
MSGLEPLTGACDGTVVVTRCGELDITGTAEAEATITVVPGQYLILDVSELDFLHCSALGALLRAQALARRGGGNVVLAAVAGIASRRRRYSWRRLAVRTARPEEGSVIAYWCQVIAVRPAAALQSSARCWLRG